MKSGIITFKEGKIRDADEPLNTNFGRGGMKTLIEDKLGRSSSSRGKEVETYTAEVEHDKIGTSAQVSKEVMVRGTQTIRKPTRWNDPVDMKQTCLMMLQWRSRGAELVKKKT